MSLNKRSSNLKIATLSLLLSGMLLGMHYAFPSEEGNTASKAFSDPGDLKVDYRDSVIKTNASSTPSSDNKVDNLQKINLAEDYKAPAGTADLLTKNTAPYTIDDNTEQVKESPAAEKSDCGCGAGLYKSGTWRFNTYVGAIQSYINPNKNKCTLYFGATEGEYFVIDDVSVNIETLGYGVIQSRAHDTAGAGISALARYNLVKSKSERLAMFIEGGIGMIDFSGRTPGPNGSQFNFSVEAGIGGRFQVTDHISVLTGPRYLHISNSGIPGPGRNPSINGVGGFAGVSFKF